MRIVITYSRTELINLVQKDIREKLNLGSVDPVDVKIETKSSQNYKAEWEVADYRAVFERVEI